MKRDGEFEEQKWVLDSSLDHKGRVPVRAKTGAWKAALFIIVIEFSERLSYFGLSANLIIYLTKVLHFDIKNAAKSVNYWAGVTTVMPLLGGFLADGYVGRFYMVLLSSFIYVMGLCLLTMAQLIPSLKPCRMEKCDKPEKLHEVIFFLAIYLVSIATGGHKPSLESFGADQFDDNHPEERKKKMSFFNWWNSALCGGLLLGVTLIVYMQDYVSWAASYIILTIVMGITIILFYLGKPVYRFRAAKGSPLTPLLQVLVAAIAKRDLPYPSDSAQLNHVSYHSDNGQRIHLCHTNKLRFLDRAAILKDEEKVSSDKLRSPWRLSTVSQVEELKLVLNMVPMWCSTLVFGLSIAQGGTFFIKQGVTMNRKIGNHFEIPPASILSLTAIGMILSISMYDKFLEPKVRKVRGKERGITVLQRIGIGMSIAMIAMFIAAGIERKRLGAAWRDIAQGGKGVGTISVFWLAPQFIVGGVGDGFALVGLQEYFYGQVPDSMRSLGIALYLSVLGIADFISGLLITLVDHLTSTGGGTSWFGNDLNHSRLDKFYCLIGIMSGLNLFVFVFVANRYTYKNVEKEVIDVDSDGVEISENEK
ncbi:NRT1/ PTR FAMILY 5.6 [Thalictrum thalictroides]|uniref:NRT1/ PTR FAMILY 5.6 n=1 Tax=Thalictrum thalictroides TaxID=46969 RepID=A0A7J6W038_THATH|nr:NRT1/ PTR FAMILY 5.6 [Thalictrum thalictroides]